MPSLDWLERGWTTTQAGEYPDALIASNNLLVTRGLMVDGIFTDTPSNRAIVFKNKQRAAVLAKSK